MIVPTAPATTVIEPNQKFDVFSTVSLPVISCVIDAVIAWFASSAQACQISQTRATSGSYQSGEKARVNRSDKNFGPQKANAPIAAVCAQ